MSRRSWCWEENADKISKPAVQPVCGAIAQLGECIVRNDEVVGSIPTSSTIFSITYRPAKDQFCPTLSQKKFSLPRVCLSLQALQLFFLDSVTICRKVTCTRNSYADKTGPANVTERP